MHCIKTGFNAYIASRTCYVHGDAFVLTDYGSAGIPDEPIKAIHCHSWLLLRIASIDYNKQPDIIHLQVERDDHWFDDLRTQANPGFNSTMLVAPHNWEWLGYKGQPVDEVA